MRVVQKPVEHFDLLRACIIDLILVRRFAARPYGVNPDDFVGDVECAAAGCDLASQVVVLVQTFCLVVAPGGVVVK